MHRLSVALVIAALGVVGAAPTPDPFAERQHHLSAVHSYQAWGAGRGHGSVVAVVDTGVDAQHPDLHGRVATGIDLVQRGTPPDDPNGHGTLVAGIIAAIAGNDLGGSGVAPQATIMPVRVLDRRGRGSSATVALGIRWAVRHGADVVNLSLADLPSSRRGSPLADQDVATAIREAVAAGTLVVAAAGNEGRRRSDYAENVPVLVVGATTPAGKVWRRSNRDPLTLFAPGIQILSTYRNGSYALADGTSFAAPIVSAGGALLRQQGLRGADAARRLVATAQPVGAGLGQVDLAAAVGVAPPPRNSARRPRTPGSPRRQQAAAAKLSPVPGGPVPGESVPGESVPGESVPGGPDAGGPDPSGSVPGRSIPRRTAPPGEREQRLAQPQRLRVVTPAPAAAPASERPDATSPALTRAPVDPAPPAQTPDPWMLGGLVLLIVLASAGLATSRSRSRRSGP